MRYISKGKYKKNRNYSRWSASNKATQTVIKELNTTVSKYSIYSDKGKKYMNKLSKVTFSSEIDQDVYNTLRAVIQYKQAHLTTMFMLLRKYNAITFNEVI